MRRFKEYFVVPFSQFLSRLAFLSAPQATLKLPLFIYSLAVDFIALFMQQTYLSLALLYFFPISVFILYTTCICIPVGNVSKRRRFST